MDSRVFFSVWPQCVFTGPRHSTLIWAGGTEGELFKRQRAVSDGPDGPFPLTRYLVIKAHMVLPTGAAGSLIKTLRGAPRPPSQSANCIQAPRTWELVRLIWLVSTVSLRANYREHFVKVNLRSGHWYVDLWNGQSWSLGLNVSIFWLFPKNKKNIQEEIII